MSMLKASPSRWVLPSSALPSVLPSSALPSGRV
jgi:hypothetical protein